MHVLIYNGHIWQYMATYKNSQIAKKMSCSQGFGSILEFSPIDQTTMEHVRRAFFAINLARLYAIEKTPWYWSSQAFRVRTPISHSTWFLSLNYQIYMNFECLNLKFLPNSLELTNICMYEDTMAIYGNIW